MPLLRQVPHNLIDKAASRHVARTEVPLYGARALAIIPVLGFVQLAILAPLLLKLGILASDGVSLQNRLFWIVLAATAIYLVYKNRDRVNETFVRSVPIIALSIYLSFAAASIGWAFSPDYALPRFFGETMLIATVILPYTLPVSTAHTLQRLHMCCVVGLLINAVFVVTTDPTPIGHAGYFNHKQALGTFSAITIILSLHEVFRGGWRRFLGIAAICIAVWIIIESESKGSFIFLFVTIALTALLLLLGKLTKVSPAWFIAAMTFMLLLLAYGGVDPISRISYWSYGDSTITGRTQIWEFINYHISQNYWFGWGFHSYWFIPNSPHNEATGFIREMLSSHSGYMELKLETGYIGYWLFLCFIYTSLNCVESVRINDSLQVWAFLSIMIFVMLINLIESVWITANPLWFLFLVATAEVIRSASVGTRKAIRSPAFVGAIGQSPYASR